MSAANASALILPRYLEPGRDERLADATHSVSAPVPRAGLYLRRSGVSVYRCPVCGNEFRFDDRYEPACTGAGATDDHPLAVMKLARVDAAQRQWRFVPTPEDPERLDMGGTDL